jgi:ribosomal-protein-alanine acetyltransferase
MKTWFSDWWGGGVPVVEQAGPRDAARLAQLHGASFHRGWGEGEFEVMLTERNTLVDRLRLGRKVIGFAVSRMAADEAEILSVAIDTTQRGRGLSRSLLMTHLGHLAGRGVRTIFLEVEENNQPARRLYEWAGFGVVGRRERYYQQPGGEQLNALLMRSMPALKSPPAHKNTGIEARCAATGMRMTEQRRVIARVLADSVDHPDVEELYRRCVAVDDKISISTVYRTVKLFEDAGIIERHDFREGRARYEQMPDSHHDHLINLRDGKVIEFTSEEIEKLQAEIARKLGYKLVDHRLELYCVPLDEDKT